MPKTGETIKSHEKKVNDQYTSSSQQSSRVIWSQFSNEEEG